MLPIILPLAAPIILPLVAPIILPLAAPIILPLAAPIILPLAAPIILPLVAFGCYLFFGQFVDSLTYSPFLFSINYIKRKLRKEEAVSAGNY